MWAASGAAVMLLSSSSLVRVTILTRAMIELLPALSVNHSAVG